MLPLSAVRFVMDRESPSGSEKPSRSESAVSVMVVSSAVGLRVAFAPLRIGAEFSVPQIIWRAAMSESEKI